MAQQEYRLGIDGGGTGCRARLTDKRGKVLGEGSAGPANLTLGVNAARDAIIASAHMALGAAGLPERTLEATSAGLGLAAANVPKYRQALEKAPLPFRRVTIRSDAEIACLGAHRGEDGAILILGTGSQGIVHRRGGFITVGGWGFALSDSGSGAILGRAGVRRSFLALEGIEPSSDFTRAVMHHFGYDHTTMLEWASNARPRDWATFARVVFDHASRSDAVALELVHSNVCAVERMLDRLVALNAKRICLMGGVAEPTRHYLSPRHAALLVEPMGDALEGALLLSEPRTR